MSDKLPIIEQLHNAGDDRARAKILLNCPDAVLLKYSHVFRDSCRDRRPLADYVELRVALMHAVRNDAGGLPGGPAMELATRQAELAAFVASRGAPAAEPPASLAGPSDGLAACMPQAKPPPSIDI